MAHEDRAIDWMVVCASDGIGFVLSLHRRSHCVGFSIAHHVAVFTDSETTYGADQPSSRRGRI